MTTKRTGIKKLPSGKYKARYFSGYDSTTGKRIYPCRTFNTEREARDWLADETSSRSVRTTAGRGVTVGAYLDHWLKTRLGIRENSRSAYHSAIEAHIKPSLGHIKLARLAAVQIESWQADLLSHVAASTVILARSVLHGALESARKKGIVRANVVAATESPKRNRAAHYPLSVEEANELMDACEGKRLGLMFRLMLSTGLRPEEAAGLTWSTVDLSAERGVVRVERVIHHPKGGGWCWEFPKTRNSERQVVLPRDLMAKLLDHRKAQLEKKLRAGQHWQDNDLVFCANMGQPIRYCTIQYHFRQTVRRAKLPDAINLYSLRHFFVTSSLLAGVNAKVVSRESGHASVSFTLDRYGSVLDEQHVTAADLRENLLKSRARK